MGVFMPQVDPHELQLRYGRGEPRGKMVVAMDELPVEFVIALQTPYCDAIQAHLDYLLDEEMAGTAKDARRT